MQIPSLVMLSKSNQHQSSTLWCNCVVRRLAWLGIRQSKKNKKSPHYTNYSEGYANEGGNNTLLSPPHKLFTTVSARRHANTHSGVHECARSIHLLFSPPLTGESSNIISLPFNRSPWAASSVLMWLGWLLLAWQSSAGTQTGNSNKQTLQIINPSTMWSYGKQQI